jgi:predicted nucleotidyltransferase
MVKRNVVGIIAEYNPFHNGHAYHMRKAVELAGARAVVVVLSSNFVQRGEPAFQDKWSRTESALMGGADLVLELPVPFSCHNAGVFARGAVRILASSGIVTHLSFGMEGEIPGQEAIVDILLHEPQPFKEKLKSSLKKGISFVEARANAVEELVPGSKMALSTPNNNLALAYLLELKRENLPLAVLPVRRIGQGFHSAEIGEFASASAIRRELKMGSLHRIRKSMPVSSYDLVLRDLASGRCTVDDKRLLAAYRILLARSTHEELAGIAEMGEGFEAVLKSAAPQATDLEDFISRCVTKRYPRGRVCRHLVHILIGLDHWTNRGYQRIGPPCIRVLGANGTGRGLLGEMREKAKLPVLSRCDESKKGPVSSLMAIERKSTDIWESLLPGMKANAEKRAVPILIP